MEDGRQNPGQYNGYKAFKSGVIADYNVTEMMLKYFIKKLAAGSIFTTAYNGMYTYWCNSVETVLEAYTAPVQGKYIL